QLPSNIPMQILHVRRYDADLVPNPGLTLELGDRIGVIVPVQHIASARAWFGDTIKSSAEFSYISLGFGMVLGVLLGLLPIRIPYDDLLGVASGVTGNPAILVYATRMAPTDRTDIGYAMIFPSATIIKVVAVQLVGIALLGH